LLNWKKIALLAFIGIFLEFIISEKSLYCVLRRIGYFSQKIKQIQRIDFPVWLVSPGIAGISHPDFPVNTVSPGFAGISHPDFPVNAISPGIRSIFLADFPASFIYLVGEKKPTSRRKLAGMCATQMRSEKQIPLPFRP
jgi:hypothetical protein